MRWYEFFINRGHQVYVISGDDSHIHIDAHMPTGVKVYYLPENKLSNQTVSFGYNLLRLPLIVKELNKIIEEISPDIVHAHQITPSGLWAALSNFHPFVITPIGSDVIIHARKNLLYKLITRYVLEKADLITSDSMVLQEALFECGGSPDKTHIIQNGVDLAVFNPSVNKNKKREELGLGNAPVILSSRGIAPLYNVDCIVEAIPKVLRFFPDAQFLFSYVMVDSVPRVKDLVNKLGVVNSVNFIGFVDHKQMPFYEATADICVSVPSSDSSPSSVYEAMACGTPAVISDLPWTKHFIKNRENALVVPYRNSEAIADSILEILQNEGVRNKLIECGLSTVKEYVDYHKNMEMMENLMKNLLTMSP